MTPTDIPTPLPEGTPDPEAVVGDVPEPVQSSSGGGGSIVRSSQPSLTATPGTPSGQHPAVRDVPDLATPAPTLVTRPGADQDLLRITGIGIYESNTPDTVAITANGTKVGYLARLIDDAMRAPGHQPRVAFEERTFTVSVTLEARNVSFSESTPVYVVLIPPAEETGIYRITRTAAPGILAAGERNAWRFSVTPLSARLTLENLTSTETAGITNLTGYPDLFTFRVVAFTDAYDGVATAVSDPVISVRPAAAGAATVLLPDYYSQMEVGTTPVLQASETLNAAWLRGVGEDEILNVSGTRLAVIQSLGREDLESIYLAESPAPAIREVGISPFDTIVAALAGTVAWLQSTFHALFG
ncbi:hypothetical protein ABH15_02205 [Methanoculleus taiwanensis]|uniref:Uncharacterized protein n=1 Tax=Methanoculleus taiwanensis TaxID=1550565 RepID=A0A498H5H6_9EURY|nr:hypothetical protein [Methanoculleus taiwanensis]RXE56974.1 hypothetical protein ABH15_02205 [Methanoculleus taiwanensis]